MPPTTTVQTRLRGCINRPSDQETASPHRESVQEAKTVCPCIACLQIPRGPGKTAWRPCVWHRAHKLSLLSRRIERNPTKHRDKQKFKRSGRARKEKTKRHPLGPLPIDSEEKRTRRQRKQKNNGARNGSPRRDQT